MSQTKSLMCWALSEYWTYNNCLDLQEIIKNSINEITIFLDEYVDFVIIKITDSGPGIPEKYLEEIFEPMFTTKDSGTGLGWATCKQFLEIHHDSIEVINNPTTFTIKLPKHGLWWSGLEQWGYFLIFSFSNDHNLICVCYKDMRDRLGD